MHSKRWLAKVALHRRCNLNYRQLARAKCCTIENHYRPRPNSIIDRNNVSNIVSEDLMCHRLRLHLQWMRLWHSDRCRRHPFRIWWWRERWKRQHRANIMHAHCLMLMWPPKCVNIRRLLWSVERQRGSAVGVTPMAAAMHWNKLTEHSTHATAPPIIMSAEIVTSTLRLVLLTSVTKCMGIAMGHHSTERPPKMCSQRLIRIQSVPAMIIAKIFLAHIQPSICKHHQLHPQQ